MVEVQQGCFSFDGLRFPGCFELQKLRFCKTRLRVQVFSLWRKQHFLILPLIDQLKPLLCHNRGQLWDFEFH